MKLIDVMFLVIIAMCLLSLAGCKDNSEPLPVIAAPAVLRDWTPEEECAMAKALDRYPDGTILWTLHDDWARMRREIGLKPTKENTSCKKSTTGAHLLS